MDLNKVIEGWLLTCPKIKDSDFFYKILSSQDNKKGFIMSDDRVLSTDITGETTSLYSFSIVSCDIPTDIFGSSNNNENIKNIEQAREISEWINEQERIRNYPNTKNLQIKEIVSPIDIMINNIGNSQYINNSMIKYMIQIKIKYAYKKGEI